MKNIIFITAILLFWSCGQDSNSNRDNKQMFADNIEQNQIIPEEIALNFVNSYVDNCNKMKGAIGILEWVELNKMVTKSFKDEVKRMIDEAYNKDSEIGLDYDPIFNAQDYPEKGFEIESFDRENNYLILRGIDWPKFKLLIKISRENNTWLIDGCGSININESIIK